MTPLQAPSPRPGPEAARGWPSPRQFMQDLGSTQLVNALVGFLFAATGPVAIILSAGAQGQLSAQTLASWIFGCFFVNGLLTIALSAWYRTPLIHFFTIPGTVLVGQTLGHASFSEVVGAFVVTGALITVLGLSGWMKRAQAAVPMPIVMGMVAGVFLRFGVDVVRSLHEDVWIAAPMVLAFLLLSAWPRAGRWLPPMIGVLLVGVVAVVLQGRTEWPQAASLALSAPVLQWPEFSWPVLLELVVPLAITVLVVQNGQGHAILQAAGHAPPINTVTLACGLTSLITAFFGSVSTCLTGPTNAIVCSTGPRERHYSGAVLVGLMALVFGVASAAATALLLAAPAAFVAVLAGLAMIRVLASAFGTAFGGGHAMGALTAFVVTVANLPWLNIGAPFWGLVAGLLVSFLLDPRPSPANRI
jgi:benzoate membrane transport protein